MERRGGITAQLVRLAAGGRIVDLDAATIAVYGRIGNQEERNRVARIVWGLVRKGKLRRAGRGRYKMAASPRPSLDEEASRLVTPPPSSRGALADTLNKFARLRNAYDQAFDDLLSEARHAIRVSEPPADELSRPSFPMRCMEPGERD